ncbi:MAG: amidohydrolase family protein [Propionicimonas sp.]|uniref:amidohydrolase n=1 Tax=Propionicimonas sp. TaxID=1955623 RepID=UPI003D0D662D
MLLRHAQLVPVGLPAPDEPVDLRVEAGRVTAVEGVLEPEPGEEVLDADGRWLIPGLWDAHVHLGQWARRSTRFDLTGTTSMPDALARVRAAVVAAPAGTALLVGGGYRPSGWPEPPSVGALDAATGPLPVVLVSGDAHAGWLNTAALARFGLPWRDEPVVEAEWFAAVPALLAAEDVQVGPGAYARALAEAAAKGVVGIVDYDFEPGFAAWPRRWAAVGVPLRIRASVYPADLDAALRAGVRTGDVLPGGADEPLVTMGSLKIISDGSLNTRTAYCVDPYPEGGHGVQNVPPDELRRLLATARANGLTVALHAIGDAAAADALDAFEATGARGTIEHAQLLPRGASARMAELGLVASVQPAHLLDDRGVTEAVWGVERASRSFPLRELVDAGVRLALGSDAPVAPLDPWLAMASAVYRGAPGEAPWHPEHSLTSAEALAASTGGRERVGIDSPADLVLLDADPLAGADPAESAATLRGMAVAATWVAGTMVHRAF